MDDMSITGKFVPNKIYFSIPNVSNNESILTISENGDFHYKNNLVTNDVSIYYLMKSFLETCNSNNKNKNNIPNSENIILILMNALKFYADKNNEFYKKNDFTNYDLIAEMTLDIVNTIMEENNKTDEDLIENNKYK